MYNERVVKVDKKLILYLFLAGLLPFIYHYSDQVINGTMDIGKFNKVSFALVNFLMSGIITLSISLVIISELNWLERKYPWSAYTLKRIVLELIISNITAAFMMFFFGFVMLKINGLPKEITIERYYFSGVSTGVIMNLILTSAIECINLFKRWRESLIHNARLEKEKYQAQYEVLKTQVNPHFLFNSLNVLSSLVHTDANKAEDFIDEFARVYRYILEVNTMDLVSVEQEINIVDSYLFLQKIRFSDGLFVEYLCDDDKKLMQLPALSLQLVVENAIKHNIVSEDQPLIISIYCDDNNLIVKNNFQPRLSNIQSTGIGQTNLKERYELYNATQPKFYHENDSYYAVLPLLSISEQIGSKIIH